MARVRATFALATALSAASALVQSGCLSRRAALASLAALPCCAPARSIAEGIYGRDDRIVVPVLGDLMGFVESGGSLDRAQAQLRKLADSLGQLDQLAADLALPGYRGTREDSITVLRLSAIYFKSAPAVMVLATKMAPLSGEDLSKAAALTNSFEASIASLEQGCRVDDVPAQQAALERARGALTSYLELAAVHNAVPSRAGEAVRIPSDAVKRDTLGQAALEGVCKAADCESVRRANNL